MLIITPESLESLFVNKGTMMPAFAGAIAHIVVDELHSFLEAERGKQVQSLMYRLERAAGRRIPRAGLSATLGDKTLAATFLRPGPNNNVFTIDAGSEGYEMKLAVKGYIDGQVAEEESWSDDPAAAADAPPEKQMASTAELAIADYLYTHLRGSNHLIFPNSRAKVEKYADRLRQRSEREGVRNEFWTHHGSLSRELREESETRTQRRYCVRIRVVHDHARTGHRHRKHQERRPDRAPSFRCQSSPTTWPLGSTSWGASDPAVLLYREATHS